MSDYKVLVHVAKLIKETRADQESFLASGRAADHAEYRHVCGIIRGLNTAEQFINDLVQRLETDDD